MGYLSCKAESSIAVSNSYSPSPHHNHTRTLTSSTPHHDSTPTKILEFEYRDLQLATNNFSDQKLLGRGSHGLVYKAVLRSGRHVAVKKPSRRPSTSAVPAASPSEFENELHILSNIHSPRFVNLVGYCPESNNSPDRLLVVEFMPNGTLYDALHKNPKPPNWGRRLRLALQTAKALEILHSQYPPVIHRDIKSANILIDRNHNARLGDFGLALRCHVDDYHRLPPTPPAGTMGYLDPLYVTPDNLSTKTDVFSFGILLLEIISGRKAIDVGYSPPSIIDWAIPLVRKEKLMSIFDPRIPPPKDPAVCKQLAVIAAKCVRSCRERRPSMKEVVKALDGLTKLAPLNSWNGLTNPCLMVDAVVSPVESSSSAVHHSVGYRIRGFECGNPNDVERNPSFLRPLRNSKRVYSDLGFRNNLMDLMAKPDDEDEDKEEEEEKEKDISGAPKSEVGSNRGLSFRIFSERLADRSSAARVLSCRTGSGVQPRIGENFRASSRNKDL